KLQVPTLMLVAGDDRLVSSDTSLAFAAAVGPAVEVRQYPGLYHEMFLEPERAGLIADIVHWITQHLGR
ncbi:MAG TPA: alpha/beta hydrolase, partial [Polyangia bacterium]|nr:alpha/beta hydrolase [Polyangia bacterium]